MRRTAATRIVSRVVLPSRVLAVGLGVGVGVLVVVICTNRSVQRLPPGSTPRQVHGGAPPCPPRPPNAREAPRLRRAPPTPPGGRRRPSQSRPACAPPRRPPG